MTVVRRTAFSPYSQSQMYQLVNDVEAYPAFLPWCADARVLAQSDALMRARLSVKKGPFDYAFTTENHLDADRGIDMSLVEGPFSSLRGQWRFAPAAGGSTVSLELEFEFAGRVLGAVLSTAFKPIADSLVEAFKQRADQVYGGR